MYIYEQDDDALVVFVWSFSLIEVVLLLLRRCCIASSSASVGLPDDCGLFLLGGCG